MTYRPLPHVANHCIGQHACQTDRNQYQDTPAEYVIRDSCLWPQNGGQLVGEGKPLIGTVKLPYEHVEKLKAKVAERKAAVA